MTIVQVARELGIGRNQAYEAARRGEIPCIKIGRRLLVPTVAFEKMLAGDAGDSANGEAPASGPAVQAV